jgi:hypothetical protein
MSVLGWLTLGLGLLWAIKRWQSPGRGAQKIQSSLQRAMQPRQEYVEVKLDDFPHLDRPFYESFTREAESLGFAFIGDLENRTASSLRQAQPTVLRQHSDQEGIAIGAYNFQGIGWLMRLLVPAMKNLRVIDIETELSDGAFVVTTNAWHSRHLARPPAIEIACHPTDTGLRALLGDHRKRLSGALALRPGMTARKVRSLDDAIAMNHRMNDVRAAFHANRNHQLTREELRGFAEDGVVPGTRQAADDIADVVEARGTTKRKPGR